MCWPTGWSYTNFGDKFVKQSFPTSDEILSLALFFLAGNRTEAFLDEHDALECPEDVCGYLSLTQAHADYGIAPSVVLSGLRSHEAKGAFAIAQGKADPSGVYVELQYDVRQDSGYRPWSVRQGVRLLLDMKAATSAAIH